MVRDQYSSDDGTESPTARARRDGLLGGALTATAIFAAAAAPGLCAQEGGQSVRLPSPDRSGSVSLEESIQERRSRREYADAPLSLDDLGQLLWAAQGITEPERGLRAAPSAGALYPVEVYVVAGRIRDLPEGVYRYRPDGHRLVRAADGDRRRALADAALGQRWIREAPAVIVLAGVYRRTAGKYGERARRYVRMEIGAVSENVYLQATARQLSTVLVGAFRDDRVQEALELSDDHAPLGLMPVGHRP